jgi:hypothetical protein
MIISLLKRAGYHNIAEGRRAAAPGTAAASHSTSSSYEQEHTMKGITLM